MDPQHRLFLECAWEALEDAGCDAGSTGASIGIFAGATISSYLLHQVLPSRSSSATSKACRSSSPTTRISYAPASSYKLDLRGPSVSVQTACSTSLVAVHLACQSLLAGECDLALAGGVSVRGAASGPATSTRRGPSAAPTATAAPSTPRRTACVGGEACGDRRAQAPRGRPRRRRPRCTPSSAGSAINNDGAAKVGYTAPERRRTGRGRSRAALTLAGVDRPSPSATSRRTAPAPRSAIPSRSPRSPGPSAPRPPSAASAPSAPSRPTSATSTRRPGVAGLIKAVLAARARRDPAQPALPGAQPAHRLRRQSLLRQHRAAPLAERGRAAPRGGELVRHRRHQRPRRARRGSPPGVHATGQGLAAAASLRPGWRGARRHGGSPGAAPGVIRRGGKRGPFLGFPPGRPRLHPPGGPPGARCPRFRPRRGRGGSGARPPCRDGGVAGVRGGAGGAAGREARTHPRSPRSGAGGDGVADGGSLDVPRPALAGRPPDRLASPARGGAPAPSLPADLSLRAAALLARAARRAAVPPAADRGAAGALGHLPAGPGRLGGVQPGHRSPPARAAPPGRPGAGLRGPGRPSRGSPRHLRSGRNEPASRGDRGGRSAQSRPLPARRWES